MVDIVFKESDTMIEIDFLDDKFYSVMCPAKDAVTSLISVVTATINTAVQKYLEIQKKRTRSSSSAAMTANSVDPNFNAMFTLFASSVNALMVQFALAAFYPLMAMQKVYVCQAQGFLAVVNALGASVTLGNYKIQNLTDQSVGSCLSAFYEENAASPVEGKNQQTILQAIAKVVRQKIRPQKVYLEALKHNVDAAFAWMIGVVAGVQDVVQSADLGSCKLPDFYMQNVFKCSCGDVPYKIPDAQARNSLFWCTGTLNMLTGDQQSPSVVYNRYSFQELLDMLSQNNGIIAYLECISTGQIPPGSSGCDPLLPRIPYLEQQGVTPIAVLSRCVSWLSASLSCSICASSLR